MNLCRKALRLLCALTLLLSLTACGASDRAAEPASDAPADQTASAQDAVPEAADSEAAPDTAQSSGAPRVLVAYFSATGNTRPIAETIAELTGADLFEIVPEQPYTEADLDYSDDACRANQEQSDPSVRPAISGQVENMTDYDVVFLGHPIWWGEEPRILDTFAETYDLSGKTVVNFCTSGSSGVSASTEHLKALVPNANWLEGHRFETGASTEDVQRWLDGLGWNKS